MQDAKAVSIIEKDINNDVLWSWTYPSVKDTKKSHILGRNIFKSAPHFIYSQFEKEWFYIRTCEVPESSPLPKVKFIALVIWAKEFRPENYDTFTQNLTEIYLETGDPTKVLKSYLTTVIKTSFLEENGPSRKPATSHLKNLIQVFGLETIIIYTALLLKKRLAVYHHTLSDLLQTISVFPLLLLHRSLNELFFPWLEVADFSLLKGKTGYIAGFCDNSILSQTDMFDVLVNLPAREITIAPHAKDNLTMTKVHKDIALLMVQMSESDMNDAQIGKTLMGRTIELIEQIKSFGETNEQGKSFVSLENIREKKFSPALENFLHQVSLIEGILSL